MTGWSKILSNGTRIDEPMSWSKTQVDNLIGTELFLPNKKLAIYGYGSYWQSDTYVNTVVPFGESIGTAIRRRIEYLIDKPQIGVILDNSSFGFIVDFRAIPTPTDVTVNCSTSLPFWFVVEENLETNSTRYYPSKYKI